MARVDPPTLRSQDVEIVPMQLQHVAGLAAAARGRSTFGLTVVPDGVIQTERYVQVALEQFESHERMPFTIMVDGLVVGSTSYWDLNSWEWPAGSEFQRDGRPDAVEIGSTWLAASVQGTNCNKRSKLLLLAHAFERWEVHRVSFRTDERNVRSRRAIEGLGASFEGVRRAERPGVDNTVRSSAWYSIVRVEWPRVRSALELRIAAE